MLEIIAESLLVIITLALIIAGSLAIVIWVRNNTRKLSTLRLFVQIVAVVLIFLGLITSVILASPGVKGNNKRETVLVKLGLLAISIYF
ncbi:MAG: hypothetical protein P8X84_04135 [Candidatus Bathyarchaeota archaeon]